MLTFGNSVVNVGGGWLHCLPPKTLRFRFLNANFDPTSYTNKGSFTKVNGSDQNDWDWTYSGSDWSGGPFGSSDSLGNKGYTGIYDVIEAGDNHTVTNMNYFFGAPITGPTMIGNGPRYVCNLRCETGRGEFYSCKELLSVESISVNGNRNDIFRYCEKLTSVPRFTGTCVISDGEYNIENSFYGCIGLTDISNIGTIDVVWTGTGAGNGISFRRTFGGIPNPLFSISGNEFDNSRTIIKNVGAAFGTDKWTLFEGSGLPSGYINILKWKTLFSGSNVMYIAESKSLTSIPTIPSGVTARNFAVNGFFADNPNVETGMLAAYTALRAITANGGGCFSGTGTNTTQGIADRAQIPTSWGGDAVVQPDFTVNSMKTGTTNTTKRLWDVTCQTIDWSTVSSFNFYSDGSISQYANVNMNRSRFRSTGSFNPASGNAVYFYPAFIQLTGTPSNSSNAGPITFLMTTTNYHDHLEASQGNTDMSATMDYNTDGSMSIKRGTYDSNKHLYFCIIAWNSAGAYDLSNFGLLCSTFFQQSAKFFYQDLQ